MSKLSWYWHRIRAMSPHEMLLHARKKLRQSADANRIFAAVLLPVPASQAFPVLPDRTAAPDVLREELARDRLRIMTGRWQGFGHLDLRVDDPPRWDYDYLATRHLPCQASAFRLNHRSLPAPADIKLIWELSRWYEPVRLAMAAYVLREEPAADRVVGWLEDWQVQNPAYRGWNWTSALETGIRLIQFTWIDALVTAPGGGFPPTLATRLQALAGKLLPAHAWHAWRHRSFGSSANNHLLGELAGLIVAQARWPELARWSTSLQELQELWEREVLAQFAPDGGNREQALSYQLFAWDLAWQARLALAAAGSEVARPVLERLQAALRFFHEVQARREAWDYGDSDDAFVTPFHLTAATRVQEWRDWTSRSGRSPALDYWLGQAEQQSPPLGTGTPKHTRTVAGWWIYPESGIGLHESGFWWLRWDLSPLGYLGTAAHGHLDLLHLSVWYRGAALIIDPGTGAYYGDLKARNYLASREAHNGPRSSAAGVGLPRRLGPFLWSERHPAAEITAAAAAAIEATGLGFRRRITALPDGHGWRIQDQPDHPNTAALPFSVLWQFAPGTWVKQLGPRLFEIHRSGVALQLEAGAGWAEIDLRELPGGPAPGGAEPTAAPLEMGPGVVSPRFRQLLQAPCLRLTARPPFAPPEPAAGRTVETAGGPADFSTVIREPR